MVCFLAFQFPCRPCRYAVKLLYDETCLGEMETHSELAEALGEFDSDCYVAPQSEEGWTNAVLAQVPHLFSIAKGQENVRMC